MKSTEEGRSARKHREIIEAATRRFYETWVPRDQHGTDCGQGWGVQADGL